MQFYAPDTMMTLTHGIRPVVRYEAFPPGMHPDKCPIVPDCYVLRMTADTGECCHWGFDTMPVINSELRMTVEYKGRCELRNKWERAGG